MAAKDSGTAVNNKVELEEQPALPPVNQDKIGSDLDQLRDILYGNQARSTDDRLNRLERQLDLTQQQLAKSFSDQLDALTESSQKQLSNLRNETVDAADQQNKLQSDQLHKTQAEFNTKIEQQAGELEETSKEFSSAFEHLSGEFDQRLKQTQKELIEQLDKLGNDLRERLHTYKEESQQRDDEIRLEFLALGAWLDDKKASRHDLGHMLMEVGQLLQQEKESSLDDPKNQ